MGFNSLDLNVKSVCNLKTKISIINMMVEREGYSLEEACRLQGCTVAQYEKAVEYIKNNS